MMSMNNFTPFTYWTAWPNLGQTEHFARKAEAVRHCALHGGGFVRKFRQLNPNVCETQMDSIEIAAK
jgi:hypothetical protein